MNSCLIFSELIWHSAMTVIKLFNILKFINKNGLE